MNIAFDAKRLFNNVSGLGNYSRNTLNLLTSFHKEHKYHLFTPYVNKRISFNLPAKVEVHQPVGLWKMGMLSSIWRSTGFGGELSKNRIDIFHGLSNEIPNGLEQSKIKTVVTIHDLIFLQYPELYNPVDREIYKRKFKYAAENADMVISVSEYTKQALIEQYKLDPSKIKVVYQTCSEAFFRKVSDSSKQRVADKYNLPLDYILSVGTIEKRKNVLNLIKAVHAGKIKRPVVVVGQSTHYTDEVKAYIEANKLSQQIHFIHDAESKDIPAIYQMASVFVYISIIEGFGIPVLEAMACGVPVITARGTTMEESGGAAYKYVNPLDIDEILDALNTVLDDEEFRQKMIGLGNQRVKHFSGKNVIEKLNEVYQQLA